MIALGQLVWFALSAVWFPGLFGDHSSGVLGRKQEGTRAPKPVRVSLYEFWGSYKPSVPANLKSVRQILIKNLIHIHAHYQMAFRFIVI